MPRAFETLCKSKASVDDPRSSLFFNLVKILGWVGEIAAEMEYGQYRWAVNQALNVCSSGRSWVRQPRLYWRYWSNVQLEEHESFTSLAHELYTEVEFVRLLNPWRK